MEVLALRLGKIGAGLRSRLLRRALVRGVGAGIEHARILGLQPWRTIVDVGANRGQFSLEAHRLHPTAQIHAFEPQDTPANLFDEIFRGVDTVSMHRVALGAEEGDGVLHVSALDDSSSLLPISDAQSEFVPGTRAIGVSSVKVRRLDHMLSAADIVAPALLKLDVQGYELNALQGCEALLGRFQYVYVECSLVELYKGQALFSGVARWLDERGFQLADIGPLSRANGRAVQADFLFRRSERDGPAAEPRAGASG